MKRNIYDKSCYNAVTGHMGRLQTVFNMPVVAGDTVSINLVGALRLSQLKRYLTLDANVHIAAYYVKHRWCYSNWDSFVKNSLADERSSATTLSTVAVYGAGSVPDYLGSVPNISGRQIPLHYTAGYNKIWNFYYRVPNVNDEVADTYISTIYNNERKYGQLIARLPNHWNTGIPVARVDATDYAEVPASGGTGAVTLLDIASIQAEYRDQIDRDWFSHRYRDIMERKWGSTGISVDVDERPELLMDKSTWLSGVDVNGTADANLGNYVGKSQGVIQFQVPPRYFNEHGMIWVVMALRFPSILQDEKHYLCTNTLTADNLLAYPDVFRSKPPIEYNEDDICGNGDTDSYGYHPYGQWYRTQPNRISVDFHNKEGFPFLDDTQIDTTASFWPVTYEVDLWGQDPGRDYFTNTDLGHWNLVSKAEIEVRSYVPTASESLYAGASHIN